MLSRTALCINHQVLSRTNVVSQRTMYRSIHIACRMQTTCIKARSVLKITEYSPVLASYTKRYSSTTQTAAASTAVTSSVIETPITKDIAGGQIGENLTATILEKIPDAPISPVIESASITPVIEAVSYIGEPTLKSIGLGSWWPAGIVQQALELLHVNCGLPWWGSIALGTVVIRTLMFPLVVKMQKNAAKMNNNMPELTRLQAEMSEARRESDHVKASRLAHQLMKFMKEKDCNPMKNMVVPLVQAPIFISVFLGLRKMTEVPVESMKSGGLWWFTDLTIPDPYYILPIVTAATLAATIELGTDSARAQALGMMRYALRAVPVIIVPFTIHFPAAILCYWCASNFVSLLQTGILRLPAVRTFYNIEAMVNHPPAVMPWQKGFVEGFKSSMSNMKASREMNARSYADKVQFHQAGRKPIQKTFAYDPTRQSVSQGKTSAIVGKKH